MASITADEVNYLVYRYLVESGFSHSAFTFSHEGVVDKARLGGMNVPPGALISFLHKGLQYVEIETHLEDDGRERRCDAPFGLLTPHTCTGRREAPNAIGGARGAGAVAGSGAGSGAGAGAGQGRDLAGAGAASGAGASAAAIPADGAALVADEASPELTILKGHANDVLTCAWNPNAELLASGAGDNTARVWNLAGTESVPAVLSHGATQGGGVSTLEWSPSGSQLATGATDGVVRIWDQFGDLQATFNEHTAAIMSLKWNPSGELLVTGGFDSDAIVWDVKSRSVKQRFTQAGSTLDLDWRSDEQFAACSSDNHIYVHELGQTEPVTTFSAHTKDVNMIGWDPSRSLLASGSDDRTAMIWNLKAGLLHSLNEHEKEVYCVQWSPRANPLTLATGSYDCTAKIWDAERGKCLFTMRKHTEEICSVAFSPSGEYLATGSTDKHVHIFSTKDGSYVRSFRGGGQVFEVSWNGAGDKVAASYEKGTVGVLDFRR